MKKDYLSLTKNPEEMAKIYRAFIFEMANGQPVHLLNTYSEEQKAEFIKAVYKVMKPNLN